MSKMLQAKRVVKATSKRHTKLFFRILGLLELNMLFAEYKYYTYMQVHIYYFNGIISRHKEYLEI